MKICLKSSIISCKQVLRVHKKGAESHLQRTEPYEVERKLNESIFRVPTGELLKITLKHFHKYKIDTDYTYYE